MKQLGEFEIDGKQFSLAQGEWEGKVESPTSASLLRPTSLPDLQLEGHSLVANLLRLHTEEPEFAVLPFPEDTEDLHDAELQAKIIEEGARIWREHYTPDDFPETSEPDMSETEDEPDEEPKRKRSGHDVVRRLLIDDVPAPYFFILALAGLAQVFSYVGALVGATIVAVGLQLVYEVTVLPPLERARNRSAARSILLDLIEHRSDVAEVQIDLASLVSSTERASDPRIAVTLTRDHIAAMLNRYEATLNAGEGARVNAAELRDWARTIDELHVLGIRETGPIRYEHGYFGAIMTVIASLANEIDPWYDLTPNGIAGMRRFLDIPDAFSDSDGPQNEQLAEWSRVLDLKTETRFHWFKDGDHHLCVYAEPEAPKFGLIGMYFKETPELIEDVMIAEFTVDETGAVDDLDIQTADPRMPEPQVRAWLESIREPLTTMAAVQRL
ncbi:hypothetical protein [Glycomyces sp. NPDC048151]|uniref:hypothetical protein n=1 Tax=Glycomyces sp. NPDC048151 TaxID=3364002 RepID=UPI00371E3CA8